MSGTASIPENEFVSAGKALPRIVSAAPVGGRMVRVKFDNGIEKTVDLAPALESRRFYIPLRDDEALFRSFEVSEYGDALQWGSDLDFSAVWLEALPAVDFGNDDFCNAMDQLGMTLDGMAAALEVSRRLVADYRKDKPIPRYIALATRYLVEHQVRQ
ncbi:DUF2442 domain-containing protein [Ochrobactrum quorumnocens]|uniref:DUF2442 domain-containing protein n=1 Tax=Ochrobactrum quorumnocens TaxID=271865 RepID=A0A5N1JII7_9HYPH|nr:DUF2442 domain-containing protein [[Ochrobactrum] quorumnocens]KAA9354268.1 DUF2442 domain-containing protein [[Ochrobactrum] quorumnocens]